MSPEDERSESPLFGAGQNKKDSAPERRFLPRPRRNGISIVGLQDWGQGIAVDIRTEDMSRQHFTTVDWLTPTAAAN